jgi:hypothetical protein
VPFFREYVTGAQVHPAYPIEVCGELAEVLIPSFDWLPRSIWPTLQRIYKIFFEHVEHPMGYWDTYAGLRVLVRSVIQAIRVDWGQGTIIVCRTRSDLKAPGMINTLVDAACSLPESA